MCVAGPGRLYLKIEQTDDTRQMGLLGTRDSWNGVPKSKIDETGRVCCTVYMMHKCTFY